MFHFISFWAGGHAGAGLGGCTMDKQAPVVNLGFTWRRTFSAFLIRALPSSGDRRTAQNNSRETAVKNTKAQKRVRALTTCGDRVSGPQSYSDRNCSF